MTFTKVLKNNAYFKRYQTKYRRRRENKTDYYARRKLVAQDKNKYNSPKYRFVVRSSNKDIVCQIIKAEMDHDVVIASAYSHELRRYGVKIGYTNYAAAYATGLLLARRVNAKFGLDYEGTEQVDGEVYHVEEDAEDRRPFKAILDVGLARTTVGARLFGALKGAADGGLHVPHNEKRFPGSSKEENQWTYDPEAHRQRIFGVHVSNYMKLLQEEDPEKYQKQFSKYITIGLSADDIEPMWTEAHKSIRAEPNKPRGANEKGYFKTK